MNPRPALDPSKILIAAFARTSLAYLGRVQCRENIFAERGANLLFVGCHRCTKRRTSELQLGSQWGRGGDGGE